MIYGILSEKNEWIDYSEDLNKRNSVMVHHRINSSLEEKKIDIRDIKKIYTIAGPGSYTGMRFAEGIRQIFSWDGIKTNSFYHFEIPFLMGINNGAWVTEAFKGDWFIYSWDNDSSQKKLVKKKDLLEFLKTDQKLYTHFVSEKIRELSGEIEWCETSKLIHHNSQEIFNKVEQLNINRDVYYFRAIDEEFKKPSKK